MNERVKIQFWGGFHGVDTVAVVVDVASKGGARFAALSRGQQAKLARHFCGVRDCSCGGVRRASNDCPADLILEEAL